jgi:predicted deacylase
VAQRTDLWNTRFGERSYIRVAVTVDLGGQEIFLPVHVLRGAKPGPTLALISCVHGNEWLAIEVLRRVLGRVDPDRLAGSVLAVPVCNPVALTYNRRHTPDDTLSPDLHRSFGLSGNSIAEQLARALEGEIYARTDWLLDYHSLAWGPAFAGVFFRNDFEDRSLGARTDELARAFGYPMLAGESRSLHSASGFAGTMGIPAITIEIGGPGFGEQQEDIWLEQNVAGAFNALRYYEMYPGEMRLPEQYYYWGKRYRIHPAKGGYLHSKMGPERLISEVAAGEELGYVLSPFSLDVIEQLRAPARGLLYSIARSYPVRPGDWAFGVVDSEEIRVASWEKKGC